MKTTITTAQAMSHPDVALTINTLGQMADGLREERDALTAANKDLQDWFDAIKADHDALKDAAKLASRALNRIDAADIRLDTGERLSITKAIAALKAVL